MNIDSRLELYRSLEKNRKNPLIVYVTSQRQGASGLIAPDVLPELIEQIELIPEKTSAVDLLIESTGGDGLVAWRAISLLRSKVKKINVLVPNIAFSAATILALGADEIIMGKYGCLGPIDPQISLAKPDGTVDNFAYEDVLSFLDFAKDEVGISDQEHKIQAFKMLCDIVNPSAIGFAKRASSLSKEIGEKLLLTHMNDASEVKAKAKEIATKLNKSFFSHGHALYRDEAERVGLNIVKPNEEVESLIWKIHLSFEEELKLRKPFVPISEFLADPGAVNYLTNPPSLYVPAGMDQNVLNQIISQYIQTQLNSSTPIVVRELKLAFMESTNKASEFSQKIQIFATRNQNLTYNSSIVSLDAGWRNVQIPQAKKGIVQAAIAGSTPTRVK